MWRGGYLELFHTGIGADYSNANLQAIKEKKLPFVRCDLNHSLPFKTGSFDVAFSSHTIEHLHSPLLLVLEMKRIVRAGGIICIGLPIEKTVLQFLSRDKYFSHRGHIYGVSPESMRSIFSYAGLLVEGFYFNFPVIRRSPFLDSFFQNRGWLFLQYVATMYWILGIKR